MSRRAEMGAFGSWKRWRKKTVSGAWALPEAHIHIQLVAGAQRAEWGAKPIQAHSSQSARRTRTRGIDSDSFSGGLVVSAEYRSAFRGLFSEILLALSGKRRL